MAELKLRNKIRELEKELRDERSHCPDCGSKRWGRPYLSGAPEYLRDWERRKCSNCGRIYNDP